MDNNVQYIAQELEGKLVKFRKKIKPLLFNPKTQC